MRGLERRLTEQGVEVFPGAVAYLRVVHGFGHPDRGRDIAGALEVPPGLQA